MKQKPLQHQIVRHIRTQTNYKVVFPNALMKVDDKWIKCVIYVAVDSQGFVDMSAPAFSRQEDKFMDNFTEV